MKRLTKEDIENVVCDSSIMFSLGRTVGKSLTSRILYEMLEYKTLEEKYGIQFSVLTELLKGVCVKVPGSGIIYAGSPLLCFGENKDRELELQFNVGSIWYSVKDYKKTWALNEEDFEEIDDKEIEILKAVMKKGLYAWHQDRSRGIAYIKSGLRYGMNEEGSFIDVTYPVLKFYPSGGTLLYFKDYGKTWALTEEELKEKKYV